MDGLLNKMIESIDKCFNLEGLLAHEKILIEDSTKFMDLTYEERTRVRIDYINTYGQHIREDYCLGLCPYNSVCKFIYQK